MTDPQIVAIVQLAAILAVFLAGLWFVGQVFEWVSPEEQPRRRLEKAVHCGPGRHNVPPDRAVWSFEKGWVCHQCKFKAQAGSFRPHGVL